jgi:hypothetical protein
VGALLGEGDVVEEEDACGTGEGLGQVGAVALEDLVLVPGAWVDELLERLFGVGAGQPLGQGDAAGAGLDALALAVAEEPLEVDAGPAGRLGLGEVLGELGGVVAEAAEDGGIEFWGGGLHGKLDVRTASDDSGV